MRDAPILTYYFPQALTASALPKMVFFSGHSSNVVPMREFLGDHDGQKTPPASSIWVNFFECEECDGDERYQLEILYCSNPRDLSECKLLNPIDGGEQQSVTNAAFETWLTAGQASYATQNGLDSLDMQNICNTDYVHDAENHPYMDTDKFYHDLLTMYGFQP